MAVEGFSQSLFNSAAAKKQSVPAWHKVFACPIPSISPPFLEDGRLDLSGLEKQVEQYLEWGFTTLMLTAGDSHFACLTDQELFQVTETVLKCAGNRGKVIAADRYFATPAALEFARKARDLGAVCYMAMPPDWGASMTPDLLVEHYRQIGQIIPVMIVTNVFSPRGPMGFGLEVCRRLLEVPEVIAVKDDVCGAFGRAMCTMLSGTKSVIAGGQKQNHFDLAAYGACGYLATFARFQPEVTRVYWQACQQGNYELALRIIREIDMKYFQLIMGFRGGFNAGIYGSLELAGVARRFRRKPYATISDEDFARLRAFHEEVPDLLASCMK